MGGRPRLLLPRPCATLLRMSDSSSPAGDRPAGGPVPAPAPTPTTAVPTPTVTAAQARAAGAPAGVGTRAIAPPPRPKPMGPFQLLLLAAAMVGLAFAIVSWTQVAPALAEVIFLTGDAYTGERPLALGDRLPPQAPVRLEADARCFLQLPSGMVLRLSNQATVSLATKDRPLALTSGRLDAEPGYGMEDMVTLAPPVAFELPDGVSLVAQSSRYTLQVSAGRSTLAVFEGQVDVTSGGKVERIGKNEGSLIEPGKAPRRVALPTAPSIVLPARDTKLDAIAPVVACAPVEGAARYEWEARLDSGKAGAMVEAALEGPTGTIPRLPADGRYRLRARAVSADGLAGPLSEPVLVSLALYATIDRSYELSHNYQINGHSKDALEEAQRGLALWPESPRHLRVRALALRDAKDVEGAIEIAKRLASSTEPLARDELVKLIGELRKSHPGHAGVAALIVPTGRRR